MIAPERESRLQLHVVQSTSTGQDLREELQLGLTVQPRKLPCRLLYDELGSALFEQICALPEYYPTRAEDEILSTRAAEITALFPAATSVVELGSGSAQKTRHLLTAWIQQHKRAHYVPIDISPTALEQSAEQLGADYPELRVTGIVAEYGDALAQLQELLTGPKLILLLGSNIGNFSRADAKAFLATITQSLSPGDGLLVGIDLRKSKTILEAAYDDAQGVTARFNKNILAHLNTEFGANFDLDQFDHQAVWNPADGCIQMNLVSRQPQSIRIEALALDLKLEAGEKIHTESSHKYSQEEIQDLAHSANLGVKHLWFDQKQRFSLNLMQPKQC